MCNHIVSVVDHVVIFILLLKVLLTVQVGLSILVLKAFASFLGDDVVLLLTNLLWSHEVRVALSPPLILLRSGTLSASERAEVVVRLPVELLLGICIVQGLSRLASGVMLGKPLGGEVLLYKCHHIGINLGHQSASSIGTLNQALSIIFAEQVYILHVY